MGKKIQEHSPNDTGGILRIMYGNPPEGMY